MPQGEMNVDEVVVCGSGFGHTKPSMSSAGHRQFLRTNERTDDTITKHFLQTNERSLTTMMKFICH